ncbi:IclR family transcriptional regulator, partial [Streptomyces sp. NPDC059202]
QGGHRVLVGIARVGGGCAPLVWLSLLGPGRLGVPGAGRAVAPAAPGVPQPSMDNMMTWLRFSEWM